MRVSVTLYDDDLPGNQAILVSGQAVTEDLAGVYVALGQAVGSFMAHLGPGVLDPDHEERPA